jgi:UDP-N-acetylglucosamine 2-epimerase (non-hydrolysing)
MKVSMVLGIRPDIIRASQIIELLRNHYKKEFELIWTGQHYSPNLKDIFFENLNVGMPDVELNVQGETDAEISGNGIKALFTHLAETKPKVVVFLGDTNTVLTSLAAAQLNIPIIHIEGCMRSYDWRMPEEKYRTVVDHISDRIFAYTEFYRENGIAEGIHPNRIIVTGNPIVEVLNKFIKSEKYSSVIYGTLSDRSLESKKYYLATCHRRENVESEKSLRNIFKLFSALDSPVILPLSYRTEKKLKEYKIEIPKNVFIEEPLPYAEFIALLNKSLAVLTDSGTVIEEACILGVPSIQLRKSTERPEVYEVESSVKYDPSIENSIIDVLECLNSLLTTTWEHPFGDGSASIRIFNGIVDFEELNISSRIPDFSNPSVKKAYQVNE